MIPMDNIFHIFTFTHFEVKPTRVPLPIHLGSVKLVFHVICFPIVFMKMNLKMGYREQAVSNDISSRICCEDEQLIVHAYAVRMNN